MRGLRLTVVGVILGGMVLGGGPLFAGTYGGGAGTADDPFRIGNPAHWRELTNSSADWGMQFVLTADIDMGGAAIMPVARDIIPANYQFDGVAFAGVLDGNGHVIRNVVVNQPGGDRVGLFGQIDHGGRILNLGIEGADITGGDSVGGIVGRNDNGRIASCHVGGTVRGAGNYSYVGGIAGTCQYGTISDCYTTGTVNATGSHSSAGGLVGYSSGIITSCYTTGAVNGARWAGGLVGANADGGAITSCYAAAAVTGRSYVGGLVGYDYMGAMTSCYAAGRVTGASYVGGLLGRSYGSAVSTCYATGAVSGTGEDIGGLVGFNYAGLVTRCYATGTVTGGTSVGGFVGENLGTLVACFWDTQASLVLVGIGAGTSTGITNKTTPEMKMLSTFTDAGWDFVGETVNGTADVWRMCVNGVSYPRLAWGWVERCDFTCPDGIGMEDLLYLADRWLMTEPATAGAADLNGDGRISFADYAILAEHWLTDN